MNDGTSTRTNACAIKQEPIQAVTLLGYLQQGAGDSYPMHWHSWVPTFLITLVKSFFVPLESFKEFNHIGIITFPAVLALFWFSSPSSFRHPLF